MNSIGRNRIFELLGAKPKNPRWSWCALSTNRRGAIFTIWEDEIRDGRSRLFWPQYEARARPGATEKREILDIVLRKHIPVYGLICVAADPSASPRSIKEVKSEFVVRLHVERDGETVFGKHIEKVHVLEAAREIAGTAHTTSDALSDLDDRPAGNLSPDRAAAVRSRFVRDPQVREYVLQIADGHCEYCREQGFLMKNGRRYVEAHHIISLSAIGRDTVDNVIALCPNHHRQAHFGENAEELEVRFEAIVRSRRKRESSSEVRKAPNQPVQPTPGSVTPRATEGTPK
jgi:5-methylcytosine-specific restriction protein A